MSTDLSRETPRDQQWLQIEEFEKEVYRKDLRMLPCKALTYGPPYHWFGYYDKFQTDPTDRFVLSMQAGFEGRSPHPDDAIVIGMIDLQENNKWLELGNSTAWNWQQGCMLQWLPHSKSKIIWNDRKKDRFITIIKDVITSEENILDDPIYHVNSQGTKALSLDYPRIQSVRPGYGYAGISDKNHNVLKPYDSCVNILDLNTGKLTNLFSVGDLVEQFPYEMPVDGDHKHYFNHAQWSPDGKRFLFLHRWRSVSGRFPDFQTRMFTACADGSDIRLVTDKPLISHFTWFDNERICIWRGDGFKMFKDDGSGKEELVLAAPNGHQSFLPGNEWMITDTYADSEGFQNLYLYHLRTQKIIPIGRYFLQPKYVGEFRCDMHPRLSRDGKCLIMDTTHAGAGRQMIMVDIPSICI